MAWNFLARCSTHYKQGLVDDVIISFAQHLFLDFNLVETVLVAPAKLFNIELVQQL